jgi:hypothetical protein
MATYPDNATAPITAFPVVSTITYNSTGVTTVFNLNGTASFPGEVAAFVDGILQSTTNYSTSNGGATVTFDEAPNASNLTLQTVSIPSKLRASRSTFTARAQEYSNASADVVDGNTYLINANTVSFAMPSGTNVASSSDFQVFVSGVYQQDTGYIFPSSVLGSQGIDIADNAAVKLLLNFASNLDDESDSNHDIIKEGGTASFTAGTLQFDGVDDYLHIPGQANTGTTDFNTSETSFTLDTWFKPDTGTTLASNQTLFSYYEDAQNYTVLRLVGSNSNVAYLVSHEGTVTEIYGGNSNGGSNYHVAVSFDQNDSNLRLYVNNVKVANSFYQGFLSPNANANVGAFIGTSEIYKGTMEFIRLSHSTRYRSEGLQPISDPTSLSVQSGSPLGSVDKNDTLSIRVFSTPQVTNDRFTSMIDRKPDNGIESQRQFDVTTFASQAGYEKRRLKSRRSKRNYSLTYTAITGVEKTAIENFYNARSGDFESFTFDLSHINETGTITTRFAGPLDVSQTYSTGTRLIDNYYTVSFSLQEVFD